MDTSNRTDLVFAAIILASFITDIFFSGMYVDQLVIKISPKSGEYLNFFASNTIPVQTYLKMAFALMSVGWLLTSIFENQKGIALIVLLAKLSFFSFPILLSN